MQVRITLPEPFRAVIDPLRLKWNPGHAAGNPAHVTIIYHDEAPDPALLIERLRAGVRGPFPLDLGVARRFPEPDRGAFLAVLDPTDGVGAIRGRVLAAPFAGRTRFGLHATVLHPRHGERLDEAWPEICRLPALGRFMVHEVQVVGSANETMAAFGLSGDPA